jgi:hypothetical protein
MTNPYQAAAKSSSRSISNPRPVETGQGKDIGIMCGNVRAFADSTRQETLTTFISTCSTIGQHVAENPVASNLHIKSPARVSKSNDTSITARCFGNISSFFLPVCLLCDRVKQRRSSCQGAKGLHMTPRNWQPQRDPWHNPQTT